MMTSEQLKAFDVSQEPASVAGRVRRHPLRPRLPGRAPAHRGRRALRRGHARHGWDAHVNNHEIHRARVKDLDPAFAALLRDLRRRELLERTIVLCCGEFGRTPKINLAGGRDHWPSGFSLALAGGGIRGGHAIGETDPEGVKDPVESDHHRGRPRDRPDGPRPQSGQGEHRAGDRPADQA